MPVAVVPQSATTKPRSFATEAACTGLGEPDDEDGGEVTVECDLELELGDGARGRIKGTAASASDALG